MTLFDNVFATYVRVYEQGYVHVEWEGTVCMYIRIQEYRLYIDHDVSMTCTLQQVRILEIQMKEREEELERIKKERKNEVARLLDEIRHLRDSYEVKMKEYQELFDLKIKLDKEIETYRKLLEGEETR